MMQTLHQARVKNGVFCTVDYAVFFNGMLALHGWMLHESCAVESAQMVASTEKDKHIQLKLSYGLKRPDLPRFFPHAPNALTSGFVAMAKIDSPQASVCLTMGVNGKKVKLELGAIACIGSYVEPKKRSGVCIVSDVQEGACYRYRALHLAEELRKRGVKAVLFNMSEPQDVGQSFCKHVVLQRVSVPRVTSVVLNYYREGGGTLYYEADDAIFSYEHAMENDFLSTTPEATETLAHQTLKLMNSSDALITTTQPLKELMEHSFADKPVYLHDNVASDFMLKQSELAFASRTAAADGLVRIGYFSGSPTHNRDIAECAEALAALMEKHEELRLLVVGEIALPPELAVFNTRTERASFVPWEELPQLIARADINLLPLEQTRFNECKSSIKWMEAGLVGVPSVVSYNREMARNITHGKDGFLCANTQEWEEALEALVSSSELRQRVGEAARKTALERYTTAAIDTPLLHALAR